MYLIVWLMTNYLHSKYISFYYLFVQRTGLAAGPTMSMRPTLALFFGSCRIDVCIIWWRDVLSIGVADLLSLQILLPVKEAQYIYRMCISCNSSVMYCFPLETLKHYIVFVKICHYYSEVLHGKLLESNITCFIYLSSLSLILLVFSWFLLSL